MSEGKQIISAQLRIGDDDAVSFQSDGVLAKIDAARDFAGLNRILFLPGRDRALNDAVLEHARKRGIETYLWYKVLADNDVMPERDELTKDAFGKRGAGETGVWGPIFHIEESLRFACPRNVKYNKLLLTRCENLLGDYDGLFVDNIGFPLPSLGLEGVFTCFCPTCLGIEPKLEEWRPRIMELREQMMTCSDEDFIRWGDFKGQADSFGLHELVAFRKQGVGQLIERYATMARNRGKPIGIDALNPALSYLASQDFDVIGRLVDWVKPRIYCDTSGPSSLALEYKCMALGMRKWCHQASQQAIMDFIGRSIGISLPPNLLQLNQRYLPREIGVSLIARSLAEIPAPVHPGIECSLHPEFDTDLNESRLRSYFEAAAKAPGVVLCWNLLSIPDDFLRALGKR